MVLPFTQAADFSGMTGNRELFIHDVYHRAKVSVDEQGTVAVAASAAVVKSVSAQSFRVDRPFFFVIRDRWHDAILVHR